MIHRRAVLLGSVGLVAGIGVHTAASLGWKKSEPPRMLLRAANGGRQRAGLGSYCWGTVCIDAGGIAYPLCPLVVAEGEALMLDFGELGDPRRLHYSIWLYAEEIEDLPRDWTHKTAPEPVRGAILVSPTSPLPMPDDLPPGLYVIELFTRIRRGGSTSQGFKLLVQPAAVAATPGTVAVATPVATPVAAVENAATSSYADLARMKAIFVGRVIEPLGDVNIAKPDAAPLLVPLYAVHVESALKGELEGRVDVGLTPGDASGESGTETLEAGARYLFAAAPTWQREIYTIVAAGGSIPLGNDDETEVLIGQFQWLIKRAESCSESGE